MRFRWRRLGVSLLLEALLGIGLFGTVILVVFGLFPSTHQSITQARRYTEATNLAREQIEVAVAMGAPPVTPAPTPFSTTVPVATVVDGQTTETVYNVTTSRTWTGVAPDDVCTINVTVAWDEGGVTTGGIKRQVQVGTLVTNH